MSACAARSRGAFTACGSAPGSTAWVRGRALGEADGGVVVLVYMYTVLYMYTETVYTKTVYTVGYTGLKYKLGPGLKHKLGPPIK